VTYSSWRPGDQPVFISDNSKAQRMLGWQPRISLDDGVPEMWNWVTQHRAFFE
jgi:CDP-paratose 2-epimerase